MPSSPESARAAGQLERVWLDNVEFEARPDYEREGEIHYVVDYEHHVRLGETGSDAIVAVLVTLDWRNADDETCVGPFDIKIGAVGMFRWGPENTEYFEAWLELNAVYLVWPYVRSYVAMLTALSPFASLTLETMRLPDPPVREIMEASERGAGGTGSGRSSVQSKSAGASKSAAPKASPTKPSASRAGRASSPRPRPKRDT